ncbi:hypothetical protein Nepgr_028700 [Nepenthes gracilis]|uniref:Uncharacterized protein n=1 Tax=Nepenthes gracilis TaxID=150966 RepID=A0AAD3TCJ4_NEPGR|nr:hypothetical protein Nepgr_028700 [Nepenthes gracilis]
MGNCLDLLPSSPNWQIRHAKTDLRAPACGKVHPAPPGQTSPPIPAQMSAEDGLSYHRTVKIVVTKNQLEELLKNAKELEDEEISVQFVESFWEKEGSQRWRPSLDTIPE